MNLLSKFMSILICLILAGCTACNAIPIAKPWNESHAKVDVNPCADPQTKFTNENLCPRRAENPDY